MSTDKKHNINGKLTTENIRGFFHMQEYSFLLVPVYNLLHFMIIWISVCSKIRCINKSTCISFRYLYGCIYTPYKINRRLLVTVPYLYHDRTIPRQCRYIVLLTTHHSPYNEVVARYNLHYSLITGSIVFQR